MDQAGFQALAASQGAQGVFDYAKNNNMSLDQLASIGGVSSQEMANLAQANGINTGMLSQIGYSAPAAYTPPAAGTPAISGKTGLMDVTTGQFKYFGTPEYDAWEKNLTPQLNQLGITMDEYKAGGVGARLMSNPLTDAYSSAFAANNTTGGGQAWAQGVGGQLGFGQANGFVDQNGMATGLGSELSGGLSSTFKDYLSGLNGSNPNYASGNQPGQTLKTPPGGLLANTAPTSTINTGNTGGNAYSSFDPSTDTTRGQVDSMMQGDSEYMQNARTKALQIANDRGLINSSMAAESGTKAALDAASLIGDATANQYQKSKLTTQELNSRMDLANLDAASREKIAAINAGLDQQKIDSSNSSTALSNYRAIAADTNAAINAILVSPTLTEEAKQQAINNVLMRHDEYLTFQDSLTGYNLADLVTYTE